jgi:hypothetical protein
MKSSLEEKNILANEIVHTVSGFLWTLINIMDVTKSL